MSEEKDDFMKKIAEAAELDRRKKELLSKELTLKERRADNELEKLEKNDKDLAVAQSISYSGLTEEQIAKLQKENKEYFEASRNCIMFINKEFEGKVPFFRKNLILVGGKTGEGKSTTVANVIATTMKEISPVTGRRSRVLVLTNEEKAEDVYNRITCFAKNWHYTNHNKFSDEQVQVFDKYIPILAKDGWLTVVDDNFGSTPDNQISGVTTSLEGIQAVFDALIRDNVYYDAVLIDYFQNINKSKKNPALVNWQVQEQLATLLDQYKNIYPAPIVLMAQVSPPNQDNDIPFKVRIEGRKSILNVATCALEMIADRENRCTEWIVHKSRFNEHVGNSFTTGYDKGRFVEHTDEFKRQVQAYKEQKAAAQQDKQMGIKVEENKDGEIQAQASDNGSGTVQN